MEVGERSCNPSLTFIGRFDICVVEGFTFTDMSERQTNRPPIPDSQHAPHEGGNGSRGIPPTIHEQAQPPPEQTQPLQGRPAGRESLQGPTAVDQSRQPQLGSTISRAVERTRDLYERNGWVFLPLGEASKPSLSLPNLQGEQWPQPEPQEQPTIQPESQAKQAKPTKPRPRLPFPGGGICTLYSAENHSKK
jgi:hypothetical protein